MTNQCLRDPAKSIEHYRKLAESKQSEIEFLLDAADRATDAKRKAGLAATLPRLSNTAALALYSAGAPISECRQWLGKAVDARRKYAELNEFRLEEYGLANEDLTTFSGACLIDRHAEMVKMHRRTKVDTNPVPGLPDLIEQYCQVLMAEPLSRKVDEGSLKKVAPDWLTLPPLFQAAADRDTRRFAQTLDSYLSTSWEPYAKGIRRSVKNPALIYAGTWNLFSAALCKIMGGVPDLSKKNLSYVPVDLIGD